MGWEAIQIEERASRTTVEARLLSGMAPTDLSVVEAEWASERSLVVQRLLQSSVPRRDWPQSLHWNWERKSPALATQTSTGFGVVCEGKWQGVMLTKRSPYTAQLDSCRGAPLVYIDFIEVAPWNWVISGIGRTGLYRSVGSRLFWKAVKQSEEEGFRGRVGLHSLPQAEKFYEVGCGMTPLGRDPSKQNLTYFELSEAQGRSLLNRAAPA